MAQHEFPISLFLACITISASEEERTKLIQHVVGVGDRSKLNNVQMVTTDGMESYKLYRKLRYDNFEKHINIVISTGGFAQIPNVGPNIEMIFRKMQIMTQPVFDRHGIVIVSDFPLDQIIGGFIQYTHFLAGIEDIVEDTSEEQIRLEFIKRAKNSNMVMYDVNYQMFID